jgi:hypothetical protein
MGLGQRGRVWLRRGRHGRRTVRQMASGRGQQGEVGADGPDSSGAHSEARHGGRRGCGRCGGLSADGPVKLRRLEMGATTMALGEGDGVELGRGEGSSAAPFIEEEEKRKGRQGEGEDRSTTINTINGGGRCHCRFWLKGEGSGEGEERAQRLQALGR